MLKFHLPSLESLLQQIPTASRALGIIKKLILQKNEVEQLFVYHKQSTVFRLNIANLEEVIEKLGK
jgi:hypothetical protein